jgi:hypothetical protein
MCKQKLFIQSYSAKSGINYLKCTYSGGCKGHAKLQSDGMHVTVEHTHEVNRQRMEFFLDIGTSTFHYLTYRHYIR